MPAMDATESALRAVKDRIAAALGELDEAAGNPRSKESHSRLSAAARELHACADDLQTMLMRIRPR